MPPFKNLVARVSPRDRHNVSKGKQPLHKYSAQKSQQNGQVPYLQDEIERIQSKTQHDGSGAGIARTEIEGKKCEAYERDELKANYGDVPGTTGDLETFHAISEKKDGDHVQFSARIYHTRPMGSKIIFIMFRQRVSTLQGLLVEEDRVVSQNMIHWAKLLHPETIVIVSGVLQTPKDGHKEVKSATVHNLEVKIHKLFVVAAPTVVLPFQVIAASRPAETLEKEDSHFTRVSERTRLAHRVLELRTPTSQAIFRIKAGICRLFRSYLDDRQFTEISSSKIQDSATESGASVFKVDYFRHAAFLAQSPQLTKQMCIAADMERVYEIGPVFRAEDSNTHRHLTEFTGLDLEMTINSHYSQVVDALDSTLLHIFRSLQTEYREEIEIVKKQFPHDDLVFPEKTIRLTFQDGVELLRESGWKEEDGSVPRDYDNLSTKAEQRLGQIIKEKYNTDYYILGNAFEDKFPLAIRPFYTMPAPEDERLSNSCDFFLRGEEILSGGQRIHQVHLLEQRMRKAGIDLESMTDYLDGFRWGCPPHGGGGVGLERLVMLFLNLHDIRWASLFPRDPRSFAKAGRDVAEASAEAAQSLLLHGPKARTFKGKHTEALPPLSDLIAKYGDATNTSWVDPAWTVWRHSETGAAVAYIPENGFAVAFGNPLCEPDQMSRVVRTFLAHIKELNLKPVWCCVDRETEKCLAQDLGWSAVIAVAEGRLDPTAVSLQDDKNVRRKLHRAEREGVKLHEVVGEPDEAFKEKVEERLKDWKASRKHTQVHLTGLRPFDDVAHRRYYYATDKEGKICCLLVLAQLSATHGIQIKWSLEFPGAPGGAIEYILSDVIKKIGEAGVRRATFGVGATRTLQQVENIGGIRVMLLEKIYNGLSRTFSLTSKGDFRQKFGVHEDPLYICYPKGSLGVKGVNAIMSIVQKPK